MSSLAADVLKFVETDLHENRQVPVKTSNAPVGARYFTQNGEFLPCQLVTDILSAERFVLQHQQLYVYRSGRYIETNPEFIKTIAKKMLKDRYRDSRGTEVAKQISTESWREDYFFANDLNEINLANGILNWRTGKLRSHSPEYPSRVQIPIEHNPATDCPAIKKFFADVLHPDCISLVEEVFGYCLIPDVSMQKAFLLKSGGESGKSVFLDLLASFLGRGNVAHEMLQDLGENRFRSANLFGKLANIFADLPSQYLEDTAVFKSLVSGDAITGERKGAHPFVFRNTARLLFSANEIPRSGDNSHGFFRRWIIIDFPHSFPVGHPGRDERLLEKLTTPEELSGLLNLALTGLRRLKERGYFAEPTSCQAELSEYKRTNDSVRLFADERLRAVDTGLRTDRVYLFSQYRNFCTDEGLRPVSARRFYSKIEELFPAAESVISGGVRFYGGIVLK